MPVEILFRLLAELGPMAFWIIIFFDGLAGVFVLYVGIAMRATLRARDPEQQQVRYQIFRDLLQLFLCGRDQ
jgi:hypothetical protein